MSRLQKIIPLVILFALKVIDCFAQPGTYKLHPDQYRAINWTMGDGLSDNLANVMIKDVKGFLWVGSISGELCRFDGADFKKYIPDKQKPGAINSDKVYALIEDSLNNIWIGTANGLSRYDMQADTFTNFLPLIDSASSEATVIPFWATKELVFCLEPGLWITSYNVRSPVRKKLKKLSQEDKLGIGFSTIYSIFDAGSNSIWMLPQHGLLQIPLKDGKSQLFTWPRNKNRANHVDSEAMRLDRKRNSIWINSGDGLLEFTLADKRFKQIDALNEFVKLKDYDRYVGIDKDKDGRIWLATKPKGILIYDPKTEQVIQLFSDPDLQQQIAEGILHIYCDRDGIAWVSDYVGKGVYELLPFNPPVKRYVANPKLQDSLSNNAVLTIIPAAKGKMWIGTNDGLNIFDPITEKFEVLREKDLPGIKGNAIVPLYIDTVHQNAWLSVTGSPEPYWQMDIYEMDIKTRKCRPILFRNGTNLTDTLSIYSAWIWPYKKGILVCNEMQGIFEIKEGNLFADLLIPFKAILSRFDLLEDHIFLRSFKSLPNFSYQNINGNWIKIPHLLDSLEWQYILYNKKDQTHWVSFKYELVHYTKEFRKIKTYGLEDGYDGAIHKMLIDTAGNLWFFNALKQIGRLNTTTGIITTLSEADGYQKLNFDHHGPAAKDAQGNLYFGTGGDIGMGGLCRIYPERYSTINTAYVYLRSLTVNQKTFPLSTGINNLQELSLQYDENTINIETGIIDFYAKGKGRLRYKLESEGKKENWQYATAHYTIRYDGLVPGKYKLILQASNAGNEFNGPQKILLITISPPFWQTWWFRILAGIAFISVIYGIIQYRSRNLRQRNVQLEEKVQVRTQELNQSLENLKSTQAQLIQSEKMASLGELTAGIAHEIQNPLNFVNNFSEINNELIKELEEATSSERRDASNEADIIATIKDNEEKINYHGKRAESIVKGMLQHSRKSTGIKEPTDINALADEYLRLSYHGLRAKDPKDAGHNTFQADFEINADPNLPMVNVIPQDIGRVLLNVINNAFQAVAEKSKQINMLAQEKNIPGIIEYKPKVTVSTNHISSQIEIKIADNGTGISEKNREKIFQPFFTTKPTGQGTGLGLSLAYDIIKAHGGSINVVSNDREPGSINSISKYPEPGESNNNYILPNAVTTTSSNHETGTEFIITLPI